MRPRKEFVGGLFEEVDDADGDVGPVVAALRMGAGDAEGVEARHVDEHPDRFGGGAAALRDLLLDLVAEEDREAHVAAVVVRFVLVSEDRDDLRAAGAERLQVVGDAERAVADEDAAELLRVQLVRELPADGFGRTLGKDDDLAELPPVEHGEDGRDALEVPADHDAVVAEAVADETRVDLLLASCEGVGDGAGDEAVEHHPDEPGDEGDGEDDGRTEGVPALGRHFVEPVQRAGHRPAVRDLAEAPERL